MPIASVGAKVTLVSFWVPKPSSLTLSWPISPTRRKLSLSAFYLYVPEKNQDDIPIFDTSESTFSYSSLWRDNLTAAFALALASTLGSAPALADEQARSAPAFTAIQLKGPISIDVQVGRAQAVTVRGTPKFVAMVVTEVVDGELRVYLREKGATRMSGDPRIIVTVPALRSFSMEGAGETILRDVKGERFDVNYRGAGSMTISGAVKQLNVQAQGVGEVDARKLVAQDADVNFQGIGSVQIYVSGKLDARVSGMGELSYFGHPRTVNKSVSGIGSVQAGD